MKGDYAKYGKKWYEKNKQKNLERGRRWDANNRSRRVEISRTYAHKNATSVKEYNTKFSKSIDGRYRLLKHRHSKRGWSGDLLSIEDFTILFVLPCSYCGGESNGGIDRIDNALGYTLSNSTPCCEVCNHMKWNLTKSKFLNHAKRIANHN